MGQSRLSAILNSLRRKEKSETEMSSGTGAKRLIVGLGNPGRKYQENRHNIGFMAINRLAEKHSIDLTRVQNKAVIGSGQIDGQRRCGGATG